MSRYHQPSRTHGKRRQNGGCLLNSDSLEKRGRSIICQRQVRRRERGRRRTRNAVYTDTDGRPALSDAPQNLLDALSEYAIGTSMQQHPAPSIAQHTSPSHASISHSRLDRITHSSLSVTGPSQQISFRSFLPATKQDCKREIVFSIFSPTWWTQSSQVWPTL